jgi:hypothetical protein
MSQPRVDNRTDFAVHPQLLLDRDGEKLAAIVKATFECARTTGGLLEVAPRARRRGVRTTDVPWGDPEKSSIAYPSDVCLRKPATDVVVVARAHAPGGRPVPSFDVYVSVGALRKALTVHGLRVWEANGAGISAPRPLDRLDLRYDFAFGGFEGGESEKAVEEPRNPIGMGMVRDPKTLTDQPAPQIDDVAMPLKTWRTRPAPAGIGAIGRHWEPRRRHAGTYDENWKEQRAPLLPDDHDDRFNQCASPGLVADPPLLGGEEVKLLNLVPGGGPTVFALPRVAVEVEFRAKGRAPEPFRPHLDTVVVDVLGRRRGQPVVVELAWRAYVRAPRRMADAQIVIREAKWGVRG